MREQRMSTARSDLSTASDLGVPEIRIAAFPRAVLSGLPSLWLLFLCLPFLTFPCERWDGPQSSSPVPPASWSSDSTRRRLLCASACSVAFATVRLPRPSFLQVHVFRILALIPLCETSVSNFIQGKNKFSFFSELLLSSQR